MKFTIHPMVNGKERSMNVEKIAAPPDRERYIVSGPSRSVTLESNRLLFVRKRLKHRSGIWKAVEGNIRNDHNMEKIYAEIERMDPLPTTGT